MNENRRQSNVKSVTALASLVSLPWSSTRSRTLRQKSPYSSHNATYPGGVLEAVHRRPSTLGRAFDQSRVGATGPRIAAPPLQAACSHSATHPQRSRAVPNVMTCGCQKAPTQRRNADGIENRNPWPCQYSMPDVPGRAHHTCHITAPHELPITCREGKSNVHVAGQNP